MKQFRITSLVLALTCALTACGDKQPDSTSIEPHPGSDINTETATTDTNTHVEHQLEGHEEKAKKPHDDDSNLLPADQQDTVSVHEDHAPHVHGMATLSLVLDSPRLEALLSSPAANIFGFEHRPSTEQQEEILQQRLEMLEKADEFLIFNKEADCTFKSANIDSALLDKEPENHGEEHKDVYASWVYTCHHPEKVESVEIKLFSRFPHGFEQINVEWISADNASADTLDADGVIAFE